LRKSGQRFLDECPVGEGRNEKSFYGGAGGASGADEQNKHIITSTDIDINTNNKCPTKCPTKLRTGAQMDNVHHKSPPTPLGGLKPLVSVDLLSYESDSRIIGSPHYKQCQEHRVPYVAAVILDDDLADLIVDCNTMRPDAERMDFSEYYQITLPRSQVWQGSQRVCEIIACNRELDGLALTKLIREEFAPLEHQHEVERIHQRFNTPGQPLPSDDPETAWLRSHLTPLLEDMILLSIELQTECGATSVSLSRIVANEIGLTEELVVRYLLANGWRRDTDDPERFWAPRWQRHKRTEQDYQQAESWVLAVAPSAESCC
jgi:hypothetical protein